jgi:hypothetical protein
VRFVYFERLHDGHLRQSNGLRVYSNQLQRQQHMHGGHCEKVCIVCPRRKIECLHCTSRILVYSKKLLLTFPAWRSTSDRDLQQLNQEFYCVLGGDDEIVEGCAAGAEGLTSAAVGAALAGRKDSTKKAIHRFNQPTP